MHFPKCIHELVLVICCCITSYPKLSGLKQTNFLFCSGILNLGKALLVETACLCKHVAWGGVAGRVRVAQWLRAGVIWRLAHPNVWWLMLAVGRDLGLGCRPEHLHMTSPFGFLTAWWLGSRRAKRSRMAYLTSFWKSCGVSMLSPTGWGGDKRPPRFGEGGRHRPHHLKGGVSTSHYKKSIWDGICHCSHLWKI